MMHDKSVYSAILLWISCSFFLFLTSPSRKAILISLLSGWMFLPIFSIQIPGLPDLDKQTLVVGFISISCLILGLRGRFQRQNFTFGFLDLPVVLYILAAPTTALINNSEVYEGISHALARVFEVGAPYLIGRLYFSRLSEHKLTSKIFLAFSMIYLPLAIFELRFSPQLHNLVYGYAQHSFAQTIRAGVWRPMVFMRHGLELSLWFALASLIGVWFIRARIITQGFTIMGIALMLIVTFIGQSYGAIILLCLGLITLISSNFFKIKLPYFILFIFPTLYMTNRVADLRIEKPMLEIARTFLPMRRLRSVSFRLDQEYNLATRANEKMFFGWGRTGNYRILEDGKDVTVTDSRWIIEYCIGGLFGMLPFFILFFLPVIGLYKIAPASLWHTKNHAPSAALAIGTAAVLIDLMFNNFCSPIHFLIIGALTYPKLDQEAQRLRRFNITEGEQTKNWEVSTEAGS